MVANVASLGHSASANVVQINSEAPSPTKCGARSFAILKESEGIRHAHTRSSLRAHSLPRQIKLLHFGGRECAIVGPYIIDTSHKKSVYARYSAADTEIIGVGKIHYR